MCTVLLPPGYNPIAVNKYIISYIITAIFRYYEISCAAMPTEAWVPLGCCWESLPSDINPIN